MDDLIRAMAFLPEEVKLRIIGRGRMEKFLKTWQKDFLLIDV